MDPYFQALLLDVPTVIVCAFLLARYGNLRFSHPATPYLVFHIHTVTSRLIGLLRGGNTLFSYPYWRGNYLPVQPEEIERAAMFADVALMTMTAVWLWFAWRARLRPPQIDALAQHSFGQLNPRLIWAVIVVSFTIGLLGLYFGTQLPGLRENPQTAALGAWGTSAYWLIIQTWSGLALLAYFYIRGFRPWSVLLFVAYLVVMAYQGYARFRVILPVLLALHIWLDQNGRRWPSPRMTLGLVALAAAFFPMKIVGMMLRDNQPLWAVSTEIMESLSEVVSGSAPDQTFLDQLASALTLLDIHGKMYFGSLYLPLLTLPIPRQWWPDKPGLALFLTEVSIPERPMHANGMIATFIGESYANLGFLGVLLIPAALAAVLAVFHQRAYRSGYTSTAAFAHALVSANLLQVYRDGLTSLFTFTFVNMMPLTIIVLGQLVENWLKKHRRLTGARQTNEETVPRQA